ncbi:MAG: xylosidase, partial [Phycisphaerales bacterium]|nr:xylosidase [Phycisphaerales bacterium]
MFSFCTFLAVATITLCCGNIAMAATHHSPASRFDAYEGRVMCGYQGWFRAPGDEVQSTGWGHYASHGKFDAGNVHIDVWPDVSEYEKIYPTALKMADGTSARVFSSVDASTVGLHFKWMRDYGIDGVFVQRFFSGLRMPESRLKSRRVLEQSLTSSRKYDRAISVMYDLSGLKASGEDCSAVIEDWKELVDDLKLTSQGTDQTYLYDHGKPLVAIWGLGFPDRPYRARDIGVDRLINFLKHDPVYGGCSVVLGVPNYFREL